MTNYTDRLRQSAKIRFALTAVILTLAGVFLVWPNYQKLTLSRANIKDLDRQSEGVELEIESQRNEYRLLKNDYAIDAITDENIITTILPFEAEKTEIVRILEQKVRDISNDDNSLILDAVNIGSANIKEETDHFVLPVKISLTGTKEKLMIFLRTLEKTGGAAENEEQASRLIDVQDISLQIKDNGDQGINNEVVIEISANTYFLPSSEETTTN